MLKPPSAYQSCKTQITTRPVRIDGNNYGMAIIFFTPKVGDKNIDLNSLSCEFIQTIDRGEWGKEEVSYFVDASSLSNRKYREFRFETNCDSYNLKFIPPAGLKLGIIEVYFDLESINQDNNMASFNNPVNIDLSGLTSTLQANSEAQIAAINNANPVVASTSDLTYSASLWTNVPSNHVALQPDSKRIGGTIYNDGNKPVAIDRFTDIATRTPAPQYNGFIQPGGRYDFELQDAAQGVLLYTLNGNPAQQCRIDIEKK